MVVIHHQDIQEEAVAIIEAWTGAQTAEEEVVLEDWTEVEEGKVAPFTEIVVL